MCAGRGIIHAEMPVQGPGIPEPKGTPTMVSLHPKGSLDAELYARVDLPKKFKMVVCSCVA